MAEKRDKDYWKIFDNLDVNSWECGRCYYFRSWDEHHPGGVERLCECTADDWRECFRMAEYVDEPKGGKR